MKALNRMFLFVILLLMMSNIVYSMHQQTQPIKISGIIEDNSKKDAYNKVILNYNSDNGFTPTGLHTLEAKIDEKNHFEFNLPDLGKPYNIGLTIYSINDKKLWSNRQFTESGDDVKMLIVLQDNAKDSVTFSGIGAEKFTLAQRLNNQYTKDYWAELAHIRNLYPEHKLKDSVELDRSMDSLAVLIRKYEAIKLDLINVSAISSDMKSIMGYEYARYKGEWVWRTWQLCQSNPAFRRQILNNYLSHSREFFELPDSLGVICPKYLSSLSLGKAYEMRMRKNAEKIDIIAFYDAIKSNNFGILRDRLIGVCFFNIATIAQFETVTPFVLDSLLRDASGQVKTAYVKKAIDERIAVLDKTTKKKVLQTEFVDLDGNKFDLKSLRGKVFLIDIWFVGCTGCIIFHKQFEKEIYPKFAQNNNFKVLSINTNQTKEKWLAGIASERYTSDLYINVNTGKGLGFNHPFIKYYGINGAPYLMLVDGEGNIIYQPSAGAYSVKEMTEMINKALEMNSKILDLK